MDNTLTDEFGSSVRPGIPELLSQLIKDGHEKLGTPVDAVDGIREPCILVGNAALLYQDQISAELGELAHFATWGQHSIRASSVGFLSLTETYKQRTIDGGLLVPHYIRKSDAELKLKRSFSD